VLCAYSPVQDVEKTYIERLNKYRLLKEQTVLQNWLLKRKFDSLFMKTLEMRFNIQAVQKRESILERGCSLLLPPPTPIKRRENGFY
jgi:hypothetical protein